MDSEHAVGKDARDLAAVIGENAHRLRTSANLTLDQVAVAARQYGLRWSESRVADFEAGRVAPDLRTLVAFALALIDAGCAGASFHKLLMSPSPIRINESLLLWHDDLIGLLSGQIVKLDRPDSADDGSRHALTPSEWILAQRFPMKDPTILVRVYKSAGATEERIRKALDVPPMLLAIATTSLWNGTFSQERDRRAGAAASAQKRGQITRKMRTELADTIKAARYGDDK
jgi:transcriptional regulator with XRE-family HTH domain